MECAKNTAMMDLYMLNRIVLSCGNNDEFCSAFNFVLLRDYCLVFEEINNAFGQPIQIDRNINRIRQNIKLFGQRGSLKKNDDIYLKIRKIHEESFAEYENNIGLYLEENRILGSTIYNTFIFLDSDFENPYLVMHDREFQERMKNFLLETIPQTRMKLEPFVVGKDAEIFYENIVPIEATNLKVVENFDVRAEMFFDDEKNSLSFQTTQYRLLICLQELNYMVYIYETFVDRLGKEFIDDYTFMRILTRGLDSILKNLNNISRYSNLEFCVWISSLDKDLQKEIKSFANESGLLKWASKYRNMVHYDTVSKERYSNFFEVMKVDNDFKKKCYDIYFEVVMPLQKGISDFFIVSEEQQYSLDEMLRMKFESDYLPQQQ